MHEQLRRRLYRLSYHVERLAPWIVYYAATDCDGMRYEGSRRAWTRRAALAARSHYYDGAEGPISVRVLFAYSRAARSLERHGCGWEDGRDRYAEDMGY